MKAKLSFEEKELLQLDERFKKLKMQSEFFSENGKFTKAKIVIKNEVFYFYDKEKLQEALSGYEKAANHLNRNPALKKMMRSLHP